jgi:hypothetical protein
MNRFKQYSISSLALLAMFLLVGHTHAQSEVRTPGGGPNRCPLGYIGEDCDQCDERIALKVTKKYKNEAVGQLLWSCDVCSGHGTVTQAGGNSTVNRNNEGNGNNGGSNNGENNKGGDRNRGDPNKGNPHVGGKGPYNTGGSNEGDNGNQGGENNGNSYNENTPLQCVCEDGWSGAICRTPPPTAAPAPAPTPTLILLPKQKLPLLTP